MKRIGDVMKHISIPMGPDRSSPARPEPVAVCPLCQDAGFVRLNVPPEHPRFGSIVECTCRMREKEAIGRDNLRELSNLGAFTQYEFDAFDHTVQGTSEAYDVALRFAQNPDGWLFSMVRAGWGRRI